MKLQFEYTNSHAKFFFGLLVSFELFLLLAYSLGIYLNHETGFFNLDSEGNLPSWFSSVQLFMISIVFFLKYYQTDQKNASNTFFLMVSLGFMFLSLDEVAQLHEKLKILSKWPYILHFKEKNGVWIFLYAFIGLFVFIINSKQILSIWKEYTRESIFVVTGIAIASLGGVILEIISYQYLRDGSTPILYLIEVGFEEFFEMLGASIVLIGAIELLRYEK